MYARRIRAGRIALYGLPPLPRANPRSLPNEKAWRRCAGVIRTMPLQGAKGDPDLRRGLRQLPPRKRHDPAPDGDQEGSAAGDDEDMEDLVKAKDARPGIGALERVHDRAGAV